MHIILHFVTSNDWYQNRWFFYERLALKVILHVSPLCAPHISAFTNRGAWYIFIVDLTKEAV